MLLRAPLYTLLLLGVFPLCQVSHGTREPTHPRHAAETVKALGNVPSRSTHWASLAEPDRNYGPLLCPPDAPQACEGRCLAADILCCAESDCALNPERPSCPDGQACPTFAQRVGNGWLLDVDGDHQPDMGFYFDWTGGHIDQYLVGNWDGIGGDNIGIRQGNRLYLDTDFDSRTIEIAFLFGDGQGEYLVGDWDGDGDDNIALRQGNRILLDTNFNEVIDGERLWGRGDHEDAYLVGDWDGDGDDDFAVRRGNRILMSADSACDGGQVRPDGGLTNALDGVHDRELRFGRGSAESAYLVGDWDRDGRDDIGVRRQQRVLLNLDLDSSPELEFDLPAGADDHYSGNW